MWQDPQHQSFQRALLSFFSLPGLDHEKMSITSSLTSSPCHHIAIAILNCNFHGNKHQPSHPFTMMMTESNRRNGTKARRPDLDSHSISSGPITTFAWGLVVIYIKQGHKIIYHMWCAPYWPLMTQVRWFSLFMNISNLSHDTCLFCFFC